MVVRLERFPAPRPFFGDIAGFEHSLDSLFEGFVTTPELFATRVRPIVDVAEYPTETVVSAELPGVHKEDLAITFEKGTLTLRGERKASAVPEGSRKLRNERTSGSFSRAITVGDEVNPDGITAELADGILKVTLPRAEKAKPREIAIR